MRKTMILVVTLLAVVAFAPNVAAGNGILFETDGKDGYNAAGIDLELGLPAIPLRPVSEVLGWYSPDGDTHLQAGLGARLYLMIPGNGPFLEATLRYIAAFGDETEVSSAVLVGAGFRLRPVIGGIDVYVAATLSDNPVLPKTMFGARIGF